MSVEAKHPPSDSARAISFEREDQRHVGEFAADDIQRIIRRHFKVRTTQAREFVQRPYYYFVRSGNLRALSRVI